MDTTKIAIAGSFTIEGPETSNLMDSLGGISEERIEAICGAIFDDAERPGSTISSTLKAISAIAESPAELAFGAYAYGMLNATAEGLESVLKGKDKFHQAVLDLLKPSN